MSSNNASRFLYCLFLCFFSLTLSAQEEIQFSDSLRKNAVKIFIDCHRCDMNYIRQEIPYVNYVRDVKDAEVFILETRQSTGSGGSEYTYTFIGQEKYFGINDTLCYNSYPGDTRDETREGTTKMISMGLIRYIARTPFISEIEINHKGTFEHEEVVDKWNYWVFEFETDPRFEIEESMKSIEWENSINISRITPLLKYELEADQSFKRTRYSYDDNTYTRDRSYWSVENLLVASLSGHWSTGVRFDLSSSTYRNIRSSFDFIPSVEYNIFPYSESTRRQLRLLYGMGYSYNNYIDTTIYGKSKENLFEHSLDIAYRVQQKWGSVNVSLEASNYLHDFSKNRIELDGYISIRIVKGLSFSIRGSVARINNQLALPKGDLDEAEILLELQELKTAYSLDGGFGLTLTFGSIYNNIVNPRFGN